MLILYSEYMFTNLKLAILINFNLYYFLPDINIPTPTFVYFALASVFFAYTRARLTDGVASANNITE